MFVHTNTHTLVFIFSLIMLFQDFNGNEAVCMPNVEQTSFVNVYRIVIATLGYLVPLLINFICYMGVLRTMSVNLRNTAASTNQRSQEAKKRVTKIVILVVSTAFARLALGVHLRILGYLEIPFCIKCVQSPFE